MIAAAHLAIAHLRNDSVIRRRYARVCLEDSLADFTREAWHIIEPTTEYLDNWHVDACCEYLEAVSRGELLRLLINMPPRYCKSIIVSIMWPCWAWIKRPSMRWMFVSYAQDLATEHSMKRRLIIESEWYQERWGHIVKLSDQQNLKTEFANTATGVMKATSIGGSATGKGADVIVFDDPHNPKKAESEVERKSTVQDARLTFSTRLNNKKTGALVGVMQRLHVCDLSGEWLDQQWTHLCLSNPATELTLTLPSGKHRTVPLDVTMYKRVTLKLGDDRKKWPKGIKRIGTLRMRPRMTLFNITIDRVKRRKENDLLWPQRENAEEIARMRRELGEYGFASQYTQTPNPMGGGKFQRKWFRYFHQDGPHHFILHTPEGDRTVYVSDCWKFQTWDLALSEKETACWTVGATWAVTPTADLLLLDINRFRAEGPTVKATIASSMQRWAPQFQAIENAHYGTELCQEWLRRGFPLMKLDADTDKIVRCLPAGLAMENGKMYFLADAPWLGDYEAELLLFPNGAWSDQVDVTSYAAIVRSQNASDGASAHVALDDPGNKRTF